MDSIKRLIRDIPDFPKPGIIFKDITPVLGDPSAMARITGAFEREFEAAKPTRIVGIESRGSFWRCSGGDAVAVHADSQTRKAAVRQDQRQLYAEVAKARWRCIRMA